MKKYRKAIAAAVGLALLVLSDWVGVGENSEVIGIATDQVLDVILGGGALAGVWGVSNSD
jgi:hypothetical protein